MKNGEKKAGNGRQVPGGIKRRLLSTLHSPLSTTLFLIFHFSFLISYAQEPVSLCSDWVATVDEQTQNIVLRWHPSPDTDVMGYHICTGMPCVDYDTVFGRLDTSYICLDHSPLERHEYRMHVFDSAYNVSQLTPPFGNMVLSADIPECESSVSISWTPYEGMSGGLAGYRMLAMLEPRDSDFTVIATFAADAALAYTIDLPDDVTDVSLKVQAFNRTGSLVSQSNIVRAERRTARAACCNDISSIEFDSIYNEVRLGLVVDTAFRHTIWRSIDGSPWRIIDTIRSTVATPTYTDRDINRYDSLYCYQISVSDECGLNEQFSHTMWVIVPDPSPTGIAIPNIIVAGSETNGAFRPAVQSLMGDLYELSIYNRHGLLVFRTDDPLAEWRPEGNVPQGAYTYHLRLRFINNKIHTYIGTVLVIK